MTLAYVFWHWPAQRDRYEERLQDFHTALARPGTATFRLERAPFDHTEPPFEDWYPVEDWAGIGELNDAAVSGAAKAPHDLVAGMSRKGAGAIYELIEGGIALPEVAFAAWSDKRPDQANGAAVWRRQLVLGPAPEYAVLAGSPLDAPGGAVVTRPRLVAANA